MSMLLTRKELEGDMPCQVKLVIIDVDAKPAVGELVSGGVIEETVLRSRCAERRSHEGE